MSSLPIKYRPKSIDDIYGNESLKESLKSILKRKDPRKAFYFTGPPGCGKTTLALLLKDLLKIGDFDFNKYNTGNTRGIDTVRKIIEDSTYSASSGKNKMFMMEEAHGLTTDALNALLDLLENPPENTYFVFCSSEFEKISLTLKNAIKRRCAFFEVNPLSTIEMKKLLKDVLIKEDFDKDSIESMQEVLTEISKCADGSPGEALSLLDCIIDMEDADLMLQTIKEKGVSEKTVRDICKLIIDQEKSWKRAKEVIAGLKGDAESLRRGIVNYLDAVLLNSGRSDIAKAIYILSDSTKTFYNGKAGLDLMLYMVITKDDLL